MATFYRLIVSACLVSIFSNYALGVFQEGFTGESVNPLGPNTASVIVKGTADANQVANAASIDDIGVNSINIAYDGQLGLNGTPITIDAINLIPFGNPVFTTPTSAVVPDGGSVNFIVTNIGAAGVPTFASLLGGGNMINQMQLNLSVADGFEAGVDFANIKLTVTAGAQPSQTQLGKIGSLDPPFNTDPLYALGTGGMTTLSVVGVPEPSSYMYMGLAFAAVGGVRWYRKKKNNKS